MSIQWYSKKGLVTNIRSEVLPAETVLDIGCGINPQSFVRPAVHICADPCSKYILALKKRVKSTRNTKYLFLRAKWSDIVKIFPAKSIDSVFLLDVIEHLEKEESLELLKKTEVIARSQIVVFTTLGFIKQRHPDGKDAWGLSGGMWQEHKSGWRPKDFDETWRILACRFFHPCDNLGKRYLIHKGAFFAVKNLIDMKIKKKESGGK